MSYLSLLFPTLTQSESNTSVASWQIEPEVSTSSHALESVGDSARVESDEYVLPSGIASLEHWLDLNA